MSLSSPHRSALHPRRWVVRTADSRRSSEGGYGTGVVSFEANRAGRVTAWGWLGPAGPHLRGEVAIGRPL